MSEQEWGERKSGVRVQEGKSKKYNVKMISSFFLSARWGRV
jgi:hypothetical protein